MSLADTARAILRDLARFFIRMAIALVAGLVLFGGFLYRDDLLHLIRSAPNPLQETPPPPPPSPPAPLGEEEISLRLKSQEAYEIYAGHLNEFIAALNRHGAADLLLDEKGRPLFNSSGGAKISLFPEGRPPKKLKPAAIEELTFLEREIESKRLAWGEARKALENFLRQKNGGGSAASDAQSAL